MIRALGKQNWNQVASVFLINLVLLLLPQAAHASHFWTAVGSSGVVDESALGIYADTGFALTYANTGSLANITARYNVTETFVLAGTGENPGWSTLEMRSNAPTFSTVSVVLTRVNPLDGSTSNICSVTNDGLGVARRHCSLRESFDFSSFVYYITATLSRTNTSAVPTLGTLRIF